MTDLQKTHPDLAALVISMYNDRPLVRVLLEAGISGYIVKEDHETI